MTVVIVAASYVIFAVLAVTAVWQATRGESTDIDRYCAQVDEDLDARERVA